MKRLRKPAIIRSSDITPESVYLQRREFLGGALAGGLIAAAWPLRSARAQPAAVKRLIAESEVSFDKAFADNGTHLPPLKYSVNSNFPVPRGRRLNSWGEITHYNNFYEFGEDKNNPYENDQRFVSHPWSVTIDGEVEKKGTFALEDILSHHPLEERIYRMRCVEAWSMVIPWIGFPLGDLIKRLEPTSAAKYVRFTSVYRPSQMPAQRTHLLPWPYVEGLRIDEAMHPLTFMVVGLYGRELPVADGAPLRVMSPWKYGFKGGKSIVRISFTPDPPRTTWNIVDPQAYGFYGNVNPHVPHPRWSQATERLIGSGFFEQRIPTLMFNGYEEVAGLYRGMDLHRYF